MSRVRPIGTRNRSKRLSLTCVFTRRGLLTQFPVRDIQAAGLTELLQTLSTLPAAEPLTQEILRSARIP